MNKNNKICCERFKVGIDIRDSKNPSGVGRYIRELVLNLQTDNDVKLYLFHDEPKEALPYKIVDGIEFVYLVTSKAWFWEQLWLPVVLARRGINIYHATNNKGLPWFYWGRKVLTIHDVIPLIYPEVIPGKVQRSRFINTLKIDSKIADIIITDSDSSRLDIVKYLKISPTKINVIWPLIFSTYLKSRTNINLDETDNILIRSPYIIYNGGLDPRKNIHRLIEAYKIFSCLTEYSHYRLVITGRSNTPFALKIVSFVEKNGLSEKVFFTGDLKERQLLEYILRAKLCIYPSLYEGFGLPIIEAMSAGVPVITSKRSSMPEVSGGAALLIDPLDVEDIINAMIKMCSDETLRNTMKKSGLKWIKLNKDYNMVKLTKKIYEAMRI